MQAYTNRFEYLARFYSQAVTEEWHCKKFEGGLNHELRRFLVPLRIREFPVLVEQAKMVEQLERGPSQVMRAHPNNNNINEKRQEKPYTRSQRDGRGIVKCFECRGDHFRRVCPEISGVKVDEKKCYNCRKPGHYAKSCPERGKSEVPRQQQGKV